MNQDSSPKFRSMKFLAHVVVVGHCPSTGQINTIHDHVPDFFSPQCGNARVDRSNRIDLCHACSIVFVGNADGFLH